MSDASSPSIRIARPADSDAVSALLSISSVRVPSSATMLKGHPMKLPRRGFLWLAAGAAALPVSPHFAGPQPFLSGPGTLIVFVPAGGTPDIVARLVGQALSQRLGQSLVIDNRPGGGGNLALQAVARAPADGYTLLMVATPHAVNVTLYEKSTATVMRAIVPVASLNNDSFVLLANPAFAA